MTNFFRDLDWAITGRVALLRGIAASIPASVFMFLDSGSGVGDVPILYFVSLAGILGFALPASLLFGGLARSGVPYVGILGLFFALIVMMGDPLVWILHKFKPEWVGVKKFGFINPSFIYVFKHGD